jgi:hypothetical protein
MRPGGAPFHTFQHLRLHVHSFAGTGYIT